MSVLRPERPVSRSAPAVVAAILLACAGCATPIGVDRADPLVVQRQLTANAINAGVPSPTSAQVLRRAGLYEAWSRDPEGVLRTLHEQLADEGQEVRLFALAELSYLHATATGDRRHYLAALVYAYARLFPGEGTSGPSAPWDPRVRTTYDLYNRSLAAAFGEEEGPRVVFRAGRHELPFGTLDLELAPPHEWAGYHFDALVDSADFEVRGFANRYRRAGIGAPLAASVRRDEASEAPAFSHRIPPRIQVPVTAFLRLDDPRQQLRTGELRGVLELYDRDSARSVEVQGRTVPLELDTTMPLAYMLEGSSIWDLELAGFFSATVQPLARLAQGSAGQGVRSGDGLVLLRPYRPGRFPLVLVHGTASSPARWAELVNELDNDARISERFQIWLFVYNTGNPILYTASLLRDAIANTVAELDPEGRDPALRQMVVMGHSQGGLVTKLMAVEAGDRFWRRFSDAPFEELRTDDETRELLRRAMFVHPSPTVTRVVFVATPHRGSYLASFSPASWIASLISLPADLSRSVLAAAAGNQGMAEVAQLRRLPTSVDNMTPGHPFLENLLALPVAPGVKAHSIIPVLGDGPLEEEKDGVVAYTSAHVDGVESEKVVRGSGHSTQGHPVTVEEVRRILRLHAEEAGPAGVEAPGEAGGAP